MPGWEFGKTSGASVTENAVIPNRAVAILSVATRNQLLHAAQVRHAFYLYHGSQGQAIYPKGAARR
ncbi:hypothetical protein GCM10011338_19660 [Alteromonas lipolytica]|nr:hypothetical protein GCM10011338_19660 [Alteromonas lipolytica]